MILMSYTRKSSFTHLHFMSLSSKFSMNLRLKYFSIFDHVIKSQGQLKVIHNLRSTRVSSGRKKAIGSGGVLQNGTYQRCFMPKCHVPFDLEYAFIYNTGPGKSIVRLPGTSKKFCWASKIFSYLPRKMYMIYRETQRNSVFCSRSSAPDK